MKIALVHNLPSGGQKRALFEQVKILSQKHRIDLFTPVPVPIQSGRYGVSDYTLKKPRTKVRGVFTPRKDDDYLNLNKFIHRHFSANYHYPGHFPASVYSIYKELPDAYRFLAGKINAGGYQVAYVNPCFLTQSPYILPYLEIPSLYYCPEPKREFYENIPHVSNRLSYYLTKPFRLPIKAIDRKNARAACRILTNSLYSQKTIARVYNRRSFVNYLGVETDVFKPLDLKRENFCLSVGEFSLHKGHDFLLRALGQIPAKIRPKLVIVGQSGVEKGFLMNLAHSLGVALELLSNVSEKQLVSLYNKAKVFLYAPRYEPFGLVLLEASACGLPIVAVNEGGVEEALSSVPLAFLSQRSEVEFGQKTIRALRICLNKTERLKQGKIIKEKWSWAKSVGELEKHLQKIAK